MALDKLKPVSPDPVIDADRYGGSALARLAHVNYVIDYINGQGIEIEDLVDSIANLEAKTPSKLYTSVLGQSGTNNPFVNVPGVNNFLGTFTYTRTGVGTYTVVDNQSEFGDATFFPTITAVTANTIINIVRTNSTTLTITTTNATTNALADGLLTNAFFKLEVF